MFVFKECSVNKNKPGDFLLCAPSVVTPTWLPATDGQCGSPSSRFLTLNWSSWSVRSETMGESSLGDPGPGDEATRDWSDRVRRERQRENDLERESVCVWVCVCVLLSASPQHFVKEPDGVHSHHSEFWRLPAATSCYLLSPIKCHFLPPPLLLTPFSFIPHSLLSASIWGSQCAQLTFIVLHW